MDFEEKGNRTWIGCVHNTYDVMITPLIILKLRVYDNMSYISVLVINRTNPITIHSIRPQSIRPNQSHESIRPIQGPSDCMDGLLGTLTITSSQSSQ